jgi:hypothetical protein
MTKTNTKTVTVSDWTPVAEKAVEAVATLPVEFPGREVLVGAGLDTLDKVRLVFGDRGVNGETIAKIQLALRAAG